MTHPRLDRWLAGQPAVLVGNPTAHSGKAADLIRHARALLDNWEAALPHFVKVVPRDYRRALLDLKAEQDAAKEALAKVDPDVTAGRSVDASPS